jgi:uncharacterized protein (DUF1810 family)
MAQQPEFHGVRIIAAMDSPPDPFDLQRFVAAQQPVMAQVMAELRAGAKRSHWMWFVFPQLAALGRSSTARHYGIASLDEARAYLAHPVLGPRLRDCCRVLLAVRGRSAHAIFGTPDDLKLRSCLTLFQAADPAEPVFGECLARYYAGVPDPMTRQLLGAG